MSIYAYIRNPCLKESKAYVYTSMKTQKKQIHVYICAHVCICMHTVAALNKTNHTFSNGAFCPCHLEARDPRGYPLL